MIFMAFWHFKGFIMGRFSIDKGVSRHGGGIFRFAFLANLTLLAIHSVIYAVELNDANVCPNENQDCTITRQNLQITNSQSRTYGTITLGNGIKVITFTNSASLITSGIRATASGSEISSYFTNTGTIDFPNNVLNESIISGDINHMTNSGTIGGGVYFDTEHNPTVENQGTMGGIRYNAKYQGTEQNMNYTLINNTGTINLYFETSGNLAHFVGNDKAKIVIQNYSINITENQDTFNNTFKGYS